MGMAKVRGRREEDVGGLVPGYAHPSGSNLSRQGWTDWAAAGPSWAGVGPIAPRQSAVPNASSRPKRNRFTLFIDKTIIRLARSWAEMGVDAADCPEQSTLPRAISRPRRNR